jgi:hypothetical protein
VLYDNIKKTAKDKGIAICKMEKDLEIADGSICKWNTNTPGVDKVAKVAKYLETTIDELIKD